MNTIIETQQNETKKLEKVIATAESEKLAQQKDCKGVYDEKGVLVKQLIKRNEELENLYEKLKVQQSKLLHGENEYKAVCDCTDLLYFMVVERSRSRFSVKFSPYFYNEQRW